MAPIKTTTNLLYVHEHGLDWILYPSFEGNTGFEMAWSKEQWTTLAQRVKAGQPASLPAALAGGVPQEDFSPSRHHIVKGFLQRVERVRFDDPSQGPLLPY